MLERFNVPPKDEVRVPEQSLRSTVTAIFEKMGVPRQAAVEGADVLVMTDLRGVETHGVSNMLRSYVQGYKDKRLNPRPEWHIVREAPGTATIDADGGLGIILGGPAMRLAIEKARKVGVGIVTMYNSGHMGAVGHFAMMAAKEDMVGICMTALSNRVVPTFAAEPRLGTNPIAVAAPAKSEPPFLFDAATSTIAENKLGLAARVGANLLPGWVSDNQGGPVTEEIAVPKRGDYYLLPLGSTREQGSHKGYGLAMMVEVLSTFLAGTLPDALNPAGRARSHFAAYDIAAFTDVDTFKENLDSMLKTLRTTPPAEGHERVLYPGLPEYEAEQDRRANGIPLHKEVIQWFDDITAELSLPRLKTM
ncbi:MAG: Ldh family oxidoreductase [Dehalococcoidia bacterium]|nr:Ldh family oxidoreductase [Dehalococcoidia bacterium]